MSKPRAYCKAGAHYPDVLLAHVDESLDPDGLGVQCDNSGVASNLWGDGIAGVPAQARAEAEEDESPVCIEHMDYIEWEHIA